MAVNKWEPSAININALPAPVRDYILYQQELITELRRKIQEEIEPEFGDGPEFEGWEERSGMTSI